MSQGLSEQEHRKLSPIERIRFKQYIFKGIPQKRLEIVPWDYPGKNTGVGCHFLFQCMKEKSESEAAQPWIGRAHV